MLLALLLIAVQPAHACEVHETFPADGEVVRPGQQVFVWRATGDCTVVYRLNGKPVSLADAPLWRDVRGSTGILSLSGHGYAGDAYRVTFFEDEARQVETHEVEFSMGDGPAVQDEVAPEALDVVITPGDDKLRTVDARVRYAGASGELLLLQVDRVVRDWAVTSGDPDEVYALHGQSDGEKRRTCVQIRRPAINGSWNAYSEETCRSAVACSAAGGSASGVWLAGLALVALRRRRRVVLGGSPQ
jgi:MYXO-CTERM domain-containing protein